MDHEARATVGSASTELPEDGERFLPTVRGAIRYEHVHRYAACLPFVRGKRVLDVACGEGYGSALLAGVAGDVVGVDIAPSAVSHAGLTYVLPNLQFVVGGAADLPLDDGCVDVVVSFETIEHVDEQAAMITEIRRVLAPGGLLIISSPNKAVYSDSVNFTNPFHVHELYVGEFADLLRSCFTHVALFGQRLIAGSLIARIDEQPLGTLAAVHGTPSAIDQGLTPPLPTYVIALCSDRPIDAELVQSLYLDDEQDLLSEIQRRVDHVCELLDRARYRADLAAVSTADVTLALASFEVADDGSGTLDVVEDGRSGIRLDAENLALGEDVCLMLKGWALLDGVAADTVAVVIDADVVSLAVPAARPDVALVHGDTAGLSGFAALLQTTLAPGVHRLEVVAVDRVRSRSARIAARSLHVIDRAALQSSSALHLDAPVIAGVAYDDNAKMAADDCVRLRGWGFSHREQAPFAALALLVDEALVLPIRYGAYRPDVAALFGVSSNALGFEADVLGEALGSGVHQIRVVALGADGAVDVSTNAVTVTVSSC